ncbi:fimbrial protein [Burkholderia latens]|uniref:fimbrial protein n=1 Tax=Burkholderia latens TaxID=488446 RepID=UPI00158AA440|nr:fimbrial protein [Burkholderia latens]
MKAIQKTLLIAALALCTTNVFADNPSEAQVNFHGSITIPPCTIHIRPATVNLGKVPIADLIKHDPAAGDWTPFSADLTCPAGIKKLSYEIDPSGGSKAYNADFGVLTSSNLDGASGVGVRLIDANGANYDSAPLGKPVQINNYDPNKDGQPVKLNFDALMYRTGDPRSVKGGNVEAHATLTLIYE